MKRRFLSLALALVMIFSLLPTNALANEATIVTTEDELITALEAGGDIALGANITLTQEVCIGTDLTLDLNGYDLTLRYEWTEDGFYNGNIYIANPYDFNNQHLDCNVLIKDSKGVGSILGDGSIDCYNGTLTIEDINVNNMYLTGGTINLNSGNFTNLSVTEWVEVDTATVNITEDIIVENWDISASATFNFDPTEYLYADYKTVDNGDGTYTLEYIGLVPTGETFRVYYYNYISIPGEYEGFNFTPENDESVSANDLTVEYYDYDVEEYIYCPMTRLDEDGKYWYADLDTCYQDVLISVYSEESGYSTMLVRCPKDDNLIYMDIDPSGMGDMGFLEFDETKVVEKDRTTIETMLNTVNAELAKDGLTAEAITVLTETKAELDSLIAALDNQAEVPEESDLIKYQTNQNSDDVRFIAYVDDLSAYKKVSFTLTIGDKVSVPLNCNRAYSGLWANGELKSTTDIFEKEGYFAAYTITNYLSVYEGEKVKVDVTYTLKDGTTRIETRTLTIEAQ